MISEFKFFSELNFLVKNKEPFVVFKKPSHNKITCFQGEVAYLNSNSINKEKGFIMMPFSSNAEGLVLTPSRVAETEFYLQRKPQINKKIKINDFTKRKKSYIKSVDGIIKQIKSSDLEKVVY